MSADLIDFKKKQNEASLQKKEENADRLKDRFAKALPTEEQDPKKKLLNIFKNKPKDRK